MSRLIEHYNNKAISTRLRDQQLEFFLRYADQRNTKSISDTFITMIDELQEYTDLGNSEIPEDLFNRGKVDVFADKYLAKAAPIQKVSLDTILETIAEQEPDTEEEVDEVQAIEEENEDTTIEDIAEASDNVEIIYITDVEPEEKLEKFIEQKEEPETEPEIIKSEHSVSEPVEEKEEEVPKKEKEVISFGGEEEEPKLVEEEPKSEPEEVAAEPEEEEEKEDDEDVFTI